MPLFHNLYNFTISWGICPLYICKVSLSLNTNLAYSQVIGAFPSLQILDESISGEVSYIVWVDLQILMYVFLFVDDQESGVDRTAINTGCPQSNGWN